MKIRTALLATLLVLTGTAAAAAQTNLPIAFGDRVRVVSPEVRGAFWFKEMRGDTLVLQGHQIGSELNVPVASLERLDRSLGRGPGAFIGATAGVVIGGGVPLVLYRSQLDDLLGFVYLLLASAGAVLGGISGARIGHQVAPYRWEPVPLPPRVSLLPTGNRGVGVSISFDL